MASVAELRAALAATTLPDEFVDVLLKGSAPLWLSSDSAKQLSADLALCYPALKPGEVRARATGGSGEWRLTVVARDRTGLLADTAAILSLCGYFIRRASIATWDELDVALSAITIAGVEPDASQLEDIGVRLRAAGKGESPTVAFEPIGRAVVRNSGSANGDAMISVVAPDQPGLLATICRWLSDAGVNIAAAWITGEEQAQDVFVVDGPVDIAALERHLTLENHSIPAVVGSMVTDARRAGESLVRSALGAVRGLLRRG